MVNMYYCTVDARIVFKGEQLVLAVSTIKYANTCINTLAYAHDAATIQG